jgi:hypothetical protein
MNHGDLATKVMSIELCLTGSFAIIHHFGKVLRGNLQKVHRIEWIAL